MMSEAMVCNYIDKKRADVERIVRLTMAVGDVQKREGIVVDEAELAKEVANSKAEFDRMGQEYDESRVTEQAREVLEGAMVSGVRRERERERVELPEVSECATVHAPARSGNSAAPLSWGVTLSFDGGDVGVCCRCWTG
jgi:hypothetical protein